MNKLALVVLLAAAPALAGAPAFAGTPPQPDEAKDPSRPLRGVFAALGGGGGLLVSGVSAGFALDGEARLGYSFTPRLQIYLSGAYDSESGDTNAQHALQLSVDVQYHFSLSNPVDAYVRGGFGLGSGQTEHVNGGRFSGSGPAGNAGIGLEFRVSPVLHLGPELFYRHAWLSGEISFSHEQPVSQTFNYDVFGLQLDLIYY